MRRIRLHLSYREAMSLGGVSLAILTSALAGCLVLGVGQASAAQVGCGDTITTDTTLHHDLINCPDNGIVIGANGITLDLNGHTIDGDGTPAGGCDVATEFCDVGVVNFRHDGVTVKDGSLRQFGGAVNFFGPLRHNRLLGISASRSADVGIQLFKTSRSLIRDSSANRSISRQLGFGLALYSTRHVRVVGNSFRHNAGDAVHTVDSNRNLIKANLMARNGGEGFLLEGGSGFRIRHNRLVRNGAGITLGPGSHNVIKRNHVFHGHEGIRIEKGHGNLVAHNVVADARRAGIRLGIKHPRLGGAHNIVRRNVVRDSHVDGFLVGKKDRHSLLKRNVAKGAGDDGFDIQSRSTTLTRNRALRNADLGIEAVPSVIDGGGNRARDNGDPRQCTNIVCD
jgi:nitrous oxidase accessory protein NosD